MRLTTLFIAVAAVEALYGAAGLFIPPHLVGRFLGWDLSPDGQWVAKLLGLALATQAAVAWTLRKQPPLAVAWLLAVYQIGAAVVDVLMWTALSGQGIFGSPMARYSVGGAIPLHLLLGVLLMIGAGRQSREARRA
jgi:hypothetical protein